jgi:hypothetical protein
MDFKEILCGGVDWIDLAQDNGTVAGFLERRNENSVTVKCGIFFD